MARCQKKENLKRPRHNPLLYLITNRRAFRHSEEQIEMIRRGAQAGCQLIQIREKDLSASELRDFVRKAIAVARPFGARVLVNDRFDVAMAAEADGVHLRVNSLPSHEVRRIVLEKGLRSFLIGVSTHSLDEIRTAESGGADFVVFGPIYDTPSKREYGAPVGLENLAEVCQATRLPVLAIGGITLANFRKTMDCSAAGIAAIGLFTDPNNIEQNVKSILSRWV